jgi:agmatine deiminase
MVTMPAEWERHEATWIGWPQNVTDWPGKFPPIPWVYAEIARQITKGEVLRILVKNAAVEKEARKVLERAEVSLERIEFFRIPTNRGWTRDMGPMFVREDGRRRVMQFGFTGWAKYPNWRKDATVPVKAAKALRIPLRHPMVDGERMVLEGGSIDVNGKGTLLTTEECLLDRNVQVRNPGFLKVDYEWAFTEFLGASNIIWLNKGIAGDDTHGHVDDICRFVNPKTVVLCEERNEKDPNFRVTKENRERLKSERLEDGSKLKVVSLPMPAPVIFEGQRLPASYANFYICNAAVLVPTFNDVNDHKAIGILSELITDRPVVGIHALDLVWGLGTIHCLTQQQPD